MACRKREQLHGSVREKKPAQLCKWSWCRLPGICCQDQPAAWGVNPNNCAGRYSAAVPKCCCCLGQRPSSLAARAAGSPDPEQLCNAAMSRFVPMSRFESIFHWNNTLHQPDSAPPCWETQVIPNNLLNCVIFYYQRLGFLRWRDILHTLLGYFHKIAKFF